MTIAKDSIIEECLQDDVDVPAVKYDFVPLSDIAKMAVNATVGKCNRWYPINRFD